MDLAMYILVNGDIKIGKGLLANQVGHAVGVYQYKKANKELVDKYYQGKCKKIILKCSQETLEGLEKEGFVSIREQDSPQLEKNTLTCVNLGILDRDNNEIPEWVKDLKLYNK